MKNLKVLIALVVVGLLLNPTIAPAQTEIRFDKGNFETAIRRNFNGRVMGYQVILLKKGQIVSEMADGLARNPADGNVKMTVDTPANIGSTAKFFGGTALLQIFQKTNEMDSWLGKEVYKFFPKVWQDEMDDSIKQIRFRDLLQHEGGFIHNDPDPTIKVYFDYLRKGVTSDQSQTYAYGKRNYANANITTIGYVLAAVNNPLFLNMVNKKIADQNLKANDPAIEALLGQGFENYMKAKIFSQINPAISPSCDAPNEYPKKNIVYAKMYALPTTATPGAEFSSKAKIGACHAAGGWYVTGRELATYVANYAASDEIVTKPTRDLMFDDDDAKERLVWSMVEPDGSLLKNFGWNTSPYMGGDHPVGSSKAHATIVKLPNDYYAVGIINSDILNTQGQPGGSRLLTQNIIEAFKAAVAANF
ncbi:MAG TPA: serine hydrolase [Pyrinomonadaceae bacterium]|jgi:CubicO group peptidase (beta-lactamase class C family)